MVFLIYGPPGSGKTTYAGGRMVDGDIVIDFDKIAEAITGKESHNIEWSLFDRVSDIFKYLVATIEKYPEVRNTFVIRCAPTREDREEFRLIGAKFVFMDTPKAECIRRAVQRSGNYGRWAKAINKWFQEYEEAT